MSASEGSWQVQLGVVCIEALGKPMRANNYAVFYEYCSLLSEQADVQEAEEHRDLSPAWLA